MEKRRAQAVLKSLQPFTAPLGGMPQANTQQQGPAGGQASQQLQLVQQLRQQCQEQLER